MSCRSCTTIIFLLLITVLAGCGKKTTLTPPQKLVPARINDLRYILDENGVTLKWSYPTKMENGDALQAIESFEVYRAVIPEEEFCQGCPVVYGDRVEIDGGRLPEKGETRTASYTDRSPQNNYRYLYKVLSRAGWWYPSGDSNIVSFVWRVPPKVPQGLQLEPGDKKLTLSWDPVRENTAGSPLEQDPVYQIYRKSNDADFAALGEPVQKAEFVDDGVLNERLYTYKVQALVASGDTLQAGGASQAVSGVPRDLQPPEQPQHLVVVEVPDGVKLIWQGASTGDLAGYRIYRRQGDSGQTELLAEVKPDQNQYIDQSDTAGRTWFYSVTSFDAAQPVNESIPTEEGFIDLQ